MSCNILVSSAGRRVALLEILRRALANANQQGQLIATDMSRASSAFHSADAGIVVPPCTSDDFVPVMLDICRQHDVRLVVPTIDTELPVLSEHRDSFAHAGVTVAVSDPRVVSIGADKVLTHQWLVENDLPTVRQADPTTVLSAPDAWPFPLVVKPRRGSASIGVGVVTDPKELALVTRGGDYVVQGVAPGDEHTVDVYVDRTGRVREVVPRRRLEIRAGEVSKAVTERHPEVEVLVRELAQRLPGAFGALNVQLFRDPVSCSLAVIEINARFGGGYPLADAAGAMFTQWLVEEALGLPLTDPASAWSAGVVMLRYDAAVFVGREAAGLP